MAKVGVGVGDPGLQADRVAPATFEDRVEMRALRRDGQRGPGRPRPDLGEFGGDVRRERSTHLAMLELRLEATRRPELHEELTVPELLAPHRLDMLIDALVMRLLPES